MDVEQWVEWKYIYVCRLYKVYAKIIAKCTGKTIDPLILERKLGRE
jgi:hypothetical protein